MAQNSFFFEHEDLKHGHALFSTGQVGVINKIENELQSIRKKTDFFGKAHSALFINFFSMLWKLQCLALNLHVINTGQENREIYVLKWNETLDSRFSHQYFMAKLF